MIDNYDCGGQEKMASSIGRCKPNYEEAIIHLKERVSKTVNFRDAALLFFKGKRAKGQMAELIGELVTDSALLELELSELIKRQEEDV